MTESTDTDASLGADGCVRSKLLGDARQALANTPHYIVHIGKALTSTVRQFQTGNNVEGMNTFAQSMSDLSQFMDLLREMEQIARPADGSASVAFKEGVVNCVHQLRDAIMEQDFEALSNGIEGTLLPLLPMWEQVAYELQAVFEPPHE